MSVLRARISHPAWVVVAVLMIIVGPFISILTPVVLTVTTHQYSSRISYVPLPIAFNYFLCAFIFCSVLLICVYFIPKRPLKITFAIAATSLFLLLFYTGANQYQYFDREYIEVGGVIDKKRYSWSDVEEATIVVDMDEYRSLFLRMNDSKEIEILLAGIVTSKAEMSIRNRLIENNVEIKYAN